MAAQYGRLNTLYITLNVLLLFRAMVSILQRTAFAAIRIYNRTKQSCIRRQFNGSIQLNKYNNMHLILIGFPFYCSLIICALA